MKPRWYAYGAAALTLLSALSARAGAGRRSDPFDLGDVVQDPGQPKLIVLVHGATPAPTDPGDPGVPQPSTGTLAHSRFYWGYDFVRCLAGASRSVGLKTLSGTPLTALDWDAHTAPDANNKVQYLRAVRDDVDDDRLIVPGDYGPDKPNEPMVLLTSRDASRPLMSQARAIIKQVYDLYDRKFGTQAHPKAGHLPNIVWVTHSFGGPVVRTILTNPSEPMRGETLTGVEHLKAAALRDRTLYAITLAAPHEGSPLADQAVRIVQGLDTMPTIITGALDKIQPGLWDKVKGGIGSLVADPTARPVILDERTDVWAQYNSGILAPHLARRGDGTLVPIYTLIGHTPGGQYFSSLDQFPTGGITLQDLSDEHSRREALRSAEMMFADYLVHNYPQVANRPWGTPGQAASAAGLDRIARYHKTKLGLGTSQPGENEGLPFGFPEFYVRTASRDLPNTDGEADEDGLVGVQSAHGWRLGTSTELYFDHSKEWDMPEGRDLGSWYRLMPDDMPWRFTNHETIHRTGAVGAWLHQNIIAQAGPLVSEEAVSVWPTTTITLPPTLRNGTMLTPAQQKALRALKGVRPRIQPLADPNP